KQKLVFDAAANVFAQYGFRRTSMNDIANAAGISRPALYLIFKNKQELFRQLAAHLQNHGIDQAISALGKEGEISVRLVNAILAYEAIYYEPIAQSPHGAEIIDINLSIAADLMQEGHTRLVRTLADAIDEASARGEIKLDGKMPKTKPFVELLMSSISGQKKKANSTQMFRRQIKQVTHIFLQSVSTNP
ncbi:MAG: AcrR family transcriptional regulator, partial [Saprospiraceae bacterium]